MIFQLLLLSVTSPPSQATITRPITEPSPSQSPRQSSAPPHHPMDALRRMIPEPLVYDEHTSKNTLNNTPPKLHHNQQTKNWQAHYTTAAQLDSICRPSLVSFANNQDSVSANVSSLFELSVGQRWTRGRFKRTRDDEAEHYLKQRGKSQLPSGWKGRKNPSILRCASEVQIRKARRMLPWRARHPV